MTVPTSWSVATLSTVTDKPSKRSPSETGRSKVRYVDIGGLEGPVRLLNDAPLIDAKSAPSRCRQVLKTGDTVYSTVRPYLRKMARIGDQLDNEFASTGFAVLRPRPELLPAYLAYFAQSCLFEDQLLPMQKGVSYPAVLDREVRSCRIWYPALREQRRIVEIIEDHLAHLDAADASLTLASRKIDALVSSAATTWLAGPPTRLGSLTVSSGYGTSTKCSLDGQGDPVARIPNIVRGRLDMTDVKSVVDPATDVSGLHLRRGDLLIVRTNGSRELIGRCAVVEQDAAIAFASYLIRYQLDPHRVAPDWAQLALSAPAARRQIERAAASSAGQYNLSVAKLDSIKIPCPALDDQLHGAQKLRELDAEVRRAEALIRSSSARGAALRRAVLAAAFSGRLTGRSRDAEIIEEVAEP